MSTLLSLSVLLLLQSPPSAAAEPKVFAPGVVSTGQEEFGAAFSLDGNTVVFNRAAPSRFGFQVLLSSQWKKGRWTPPEILPFSGRYRDIDPAFSVDGRRLFFVTRSPKGGVRRLLRHAPTESSWAPGEPLPEVINSGKGDGNHFVDPDERYLVFASQGPGGSSTFDLYVSERKDGQWSEPRNLGPTLNGTAGALTPCSGARARYTGVCPAATLPLRTAAASADHPGVHHAAGVARQRPG